MAAAAKQADTPTSKRSMTRPSRYASQSVSPSRRRTTRSQSRELETVALKSHAKQIGIADDPPAPRHGTRGRADRMAKGKELAVVQEESPVAPARHSIMHSADNTIVEELPEETVNISGTTFLPTDSDHESGELDAFMMAEVLPDLQRAATSVLEFLLPAAQTRQDLLDLTNKLQDPRSPQSRRLDRLRKRFLGEVKYFGNQTYIDVAGVSRILPSVKPGNIPPGTASKRWRPDGILYKANCARLALEVLTCRDAMEHVLYDLEGKFPMPFMSGLTFQGAIRGSPPRGKSAMHQLTSDVALDIRTQFLKMKLEARRLDDFGPEGVVQDVFYNEPLDDEPGNLKLRGFNLAELQDDDGCLPRAMRKQVNARIQHISQYFTGTRPPVDYEGLESAFPWSDFVIEVGRWLYRRDDEINKALKAQPSIEDVRDVLEQEITRRSSFDTPAGVSSLQPSATPDDTERSSVFREYQPAPGQNVEHPTGHLSSPPHESQPQQLRKELLPAPEFDLRRLRGPVSQLYALKHINRRESLNRATSDAPEPSDTSDFAGFISQHAAKASATSVPGRNVLTGISLRPQSRDGPSMSTSPDPRRTLRGQPASQTEQVTVADSQWEITLNDDDDWGLQHASPSARAASKDVRRPTSSHNDPTSSRNRNREPIVNIPSSEQILTAAMQHKASSGKDRGGTSFIDRQANARRVSPINLDSATPSAGPSNLGKRKRADDGSEDDEFSQDHRAVDVQRKRAQKPAISPAKRARFFDYDASDDGAEMQLQSTLDEIVRSTSEAASSPQRPQASQERQTQAEDQSHHRSLIRDVMDRFPALSGQSKPRKPHQTSEPKPRSEPKPVETRPAYPDSSRTRRRWSNEENDRLIYLIENYGVSWAALKRKDDLMEDGPKLEDRDQVQLKDRARNIKIEYIRNGYELPRNFDKVGLKKADIDRLRAIGREVD
ncbi:Myb-like DNA-binding protein, putative [Paecilomyces variotii No. 5]|uniref:Myb-like DNA-binding protein, putative n=1 Tax=Byssochlamys spectabilis (strain No. 5 / NBRC 109023) TaxID=1356009 RepID=V5FUN4_BYSSN|nr:Myb-like DNA-binding protein, putative [Paecilomyces variotii No. 5]